MIIIRADGGNGIGMGHLMRTSVLADELLKSDEVIYVCSDAYKEGITFLKNKGYQVIETPDVVNTLLSLSADCIVTDNYAIDEEYIDKIRAHFDVVGYIDDNALLPYKADFIVNQNYKAEEVSYEVNASCKMLLGSRYLLVRDEFRSMKQVTIHQDVKRILLTVGGSDNWNYTDLLLGELVEHINCTFHVVIGPVFPYKEELMKKYSEYQNVVFEITPRMSEVVNKCDIAISSSGSTLYELGLLGVPTIAIIVADNQIGLATRMHQDELINCLGEIKAITGEQLRAELVSLMQDITRRQEMQIKNRAALNANGVVSIAANIKDLIKRKQD